MTFSVGTNTRDQVLKFFSQNGADAVLDVTADYSGAVVYWEVRPPSGEVWNMARMVPSLQDTGTLRLDRYLSAGALANGLTVQAVRGAGASATVLQTLTPTAITTLGGWKRLCFDGEVKTAVGGADDFFSARWTWTNGGAYIPLDGSHSDALRININDDFSAAANVGCFFLAHGYKVS